MASITKSSTSKVRKFKHSFAPEGSGPKLPNEVQASLLQVGMRVRKSVGMGYRTNYGQNKLEASTQTTASQASMNGGLQLNMQTPRGRAMAPRTNIHQDYPSSQESNSSTGSAIEPLASMSRKRALDFEDEEDNELFSFLEGQGDAMDAISTHLRPIAQPKHRNRPLEKQSQAGVKHKDEDGDPEEADSLQPASWDGSSFRDDDDF